MVKAVYTDVNYGYKGFFGLSTDTKPTDCKHGSWFMELDTGKVYAFDEVTWYLI